MLSKGLCKVTYLYVPLHSDIVAEIVLRSQGRADVAAIVESCVDSFLERTKGDAQIWSDEHAGQVAEEEENGDLVQLGHPSKGYNWSGVFLPNGTKLRVTYMGKDHFADVRHQQIFYADQAWTPSQFASKIANNTSRNAWRDIWVRKPDCSDWVFADHLRRSQRGR
jgi:hypothetical protein